VAKPGPGRSRTRWRGNDEHRLPAQKIEPYRLWFEFLKLASRDPEVQVDNNDYQQWGSFSNADFDDWWSAHWRDLFAVDIGVRVSDPREYIDKRSDGELLVRIPLYQDKKRTLMQVSELLDEAGAGERLADMRQGQFQLSAGISETGGPIHPSTRFLRNLSKVRMLMHLYRFWLEGDGFGERQRLEQTAKRYFEWANGWNTRVRERKWKRAPIEIPYALSQYVAYLEKRGSRKRVLLRDLNETDVANHRRQIARYIRKARRIAENVGRGEFPGQYESGVFQG
jgi:hypothetical protein